MVDRNDTGNERERERKKEEREKKRGRVVERRHSRNFNESEFSRFHRNFLGAVPRENRIKPDGWMGGCTVSLRFPPLRESELIYFRSNSIGSSWRKMGEGGEGVERRKGTLCPGQNGG